MPDNTETIIRTIPKRDGQEIRARLTSYRGRDYSDLRLFVRSESGEWVPTKKGLSVSVGQLPKLLEAVQALIAASASDVRRAA